MPLTADQRQSIILDLVTNCDCWKHKKNQDMLKALPDDGLEALGADLAQRNKAFAVANSAVGGYVDPSGKAYRVDPETGEWQFRQVDPNSVPGLTSNEDEETETEDDDYEDDEEEVVKPAKNRRMKGKVCNSDDDAEIVREVSRPRTTEEWLRNAPADVQNSFNQAKAIEMREKDKVIGQLLVNVNENERPAHRDRLMRRSLEDLYSDLAMVPKPLSMDEVNKTADRDPRVVNRRQPFGGRAADDDVLPTPTIDWSAAGDDGHKGRVVANTNPITQEQADQSDEEWLRTAPAHVRTRVQNALAIEDKERRRLVSEITENMTDDKAATRMRKRLSAKSLEELRDLAALAANNRPSRPSYFGAGGAPATPYTSNGVSQDDVLPLPVMDWTANDDRKAKMG